MSEPILPVHMPRHIRSSKVSCVVPAFNEHDNLAVLLPLLQSELNQLTEHWEVIIVDDGSQDKTSIMMAAWSQIPGFRYIELSRNFGKEAAITAGMNAVTGDVMILLDADLQHPPHLIAPMLARWEQGVDMPLAPSSWAAMSMYYDEILSFKQTVPGAAAAYFNQSFVPILKSILIGTPEAILTPF